MTAKNMTPKKWWIYQGPGTADERNRKLAEQRPPWRDFTPGHLSDYEYAPPPDTDTPSWRETERRGRGYVPDTEEKDAVNTALYLRRPLLVTGKPGIGKSTLAYSIAADLELGPVLHWPITSRTVLRDGLYQYDAIGRLHDANLRQLQEAPGTGGGSIEPYLRLGPLGTALLPHSRPRVLLVDELDKGDIDLPGDLLTVFEEGSFDIPELARVARHERSVRIGTHDDAQERAWVHDGRVRCRSFPVVILTSNGERDFPPPFLRRCIRLHMEPPGKEKLTQIVRQRLGLDGDDGFGDLVEAFVERRKEGDLATDQLLNAVQLRMRGAWSAADEREKFLETVLQRLTGPTSV
ncbi:AAA family ATPase [Streptomyces sp. NRRL S-920]|uniref:AAA family ATPase n=1 Tax=Streptomyces sp. NRRL S-920 TaxID=1463921 RepID=UPI000B1A864B|nr:MoxR family ATPase [Streptomyces sp. NRRL S-920]